MTLSDDRDRVIVKYGKYYGEHVFDERTSGTERAECRDACARLIMGEPQESERRQGGAFEGYWKALRDVAKALGYPSDRDVPGAELLASWVTSTAASTPPSGPYPTATERTAAYEAAKLSPSHVPGFDDGVRFGVDCRASRPTLSEEDGRHLAALVEAHSSLACKYELSAKLRAGAQLQASGVLTRDDIGDIVFALTVRGARAGGDVQERCRALAARLAEGAQPAPVPGLTAEDKDQILGALMARAAGDTVRGADFNALAERFRALRPGSTGGGGGGADRTLEPASPAEPVFSTASPSTSGAAGLAEAADKIAAMRDRAEHDKDYTEDECLAVVLALEAAECVVRDFSPTATPEPDKNEQDCICCGATGLRLYHSHCSQCAINEGVFSYNGDPKPEPTTLATCHGVEVVGQEGMHATEDTCTAIKAFGDEYFGGLGRHIVRVHVARKEADTDGE